MNTRIHVQGIFACRGVEGPRFVSNLPRVSGSPSLWQSLSLPRTRRSACRKRSGDERDSVEGPHQLA